MVMAAQNMKYHLNCLRKETRHTEKEGNTDGSDERDYIAGAICDIEIVNMVRVLSNDGVDMNSVHDSYISLRNEHGVHTIPGRNYKPDVKNILLENIPDIKFVKRGGPKPEIALPQRTTDKVLKEYCDEAEVNKDMNILCKAAAIIRKEIENTKDWQFTGTFDDFETPMKLQQLMKWVIAGPRTQLVVKREEEVEKCSRNLAQHVVSSFRTKQQLTYEPKANHTFQKNKLTPLTVGMALTSYQANRARSEVDTLNDMQLAISYDEVQRTTTRMALAIMDDIKDNAQSVHIPPFVKKGIRPLYAIDNIDLGSDAGSFHGADLMVAQKQVDTTSVLGKELKLDLNVKNKSLKRSLQMKYHECDKPVKPKVSHTGYILDTLKETFTCNEHATDIWLLVGSRVVEEITSRGGETRSDINAPLNPLPSESLEHREQDDALDVSSSVEITHNEPDADGITLEKPPSQELARRKPSSDRRKLLR